MSDLYQATYDAVRSKVHGGDIVSAVEAAFGMASHHLECVAHEWRAAAAEHQRPSVVFKPVISRDQGQYCALFGEDLMQGVAGFGKSVALAMADFDENWFANIPEARAALTQGETT